ncbi:MAG: PHB depolymerase family esterase [Gemmatimonadales bacterium]|nr:PHB depolymerase family esterase [Gemmatimonadales bacterium]
MRVLLLCLIVGCARGRADTAADLRLPPGNHDLALRVDGRTRRYIAHLPPHARAGAPLPVVIVLHGGGGSGRGMQPMVRTDGLADREGFIVVYPDGTGRWGRRLLTWNAGSCCGYARDRQVDDVGFIRALLDDLSRRTPVDTRRVYATGLSNGGMMAYRLGAEAGDRIAAIAPVSGGTVVDSLRSPRPIPILHIHSVDDPRALYGGGLGPPFPYTNARVMHPHMDSVIARWVAFDRCPREPNVGETVRGRPGTPAATHTATPHVYGPCAAGSEVVLLKLTGAGHVWPGAAEQSWQEHVGAATDVIDANTVIWRFFQRFSLPAQP